MDCRKSSGHSPVVYLGISLLVLSWLHPPDFCASLLVCCLFPLLCCFSVPLWPLLPPLPAPLGQYPPLSLESPLPSPVPDCRAILHLRFCRVLPRTPSIGS